MRLQEWLDQVVPVARAVARVLRFPLALVLGQWHVETGGTLRAGGANNLAGITDGGPPAFLTFPDLRAFAVEYIATMRNGHYERVLAGAELGLPLPVLVRLLGESPWDAGGYGREHGLVPGATIMNRIKELELDQIDPVEPWAKLGFDYVRQADISDGTRPGDPCTRQEVWLMLARAIRTPA